MKAIWDVNTNFKVSKDRKLGNTFTHPWISENLLKYISGNKHKNILDPAVGTGSFYYAGIDQIKDYCSYDCYDISKDSMDMIEIEDDRTTPFNEDFLTKEIDKKYSLIATNPQYINYNNIPYKDDEKLALLERIKNTIDFDKLGIHRSQIDKEVIYIFTFI